MRGRLLCLLLVLVLGCWGIANPGVCAENNPPLVMAPNSQQGQQQTHPITNSVPSTQETFHDIRGPVQLPDSLGVLVWLLIGLAVVALIGLFLYFWKRRKRSWKSPYPHELALIELVRLRPMMNPEQALIYAAQLSEVLRRYVEARFLIPSTRQTTREFFLDLATNPQAMRTMAEHHAHLQGCLEQCDLAKFAHCVPDQQGMEAMEQTVRGFIEATGRPVDERGKG